MIDKKAVLVLESDADLAEAISAFIEPHFTATISHDLADGELLFRDDRYAGLLLNTTLSPKLESVLALITRLRLEGDRRFIVAISPRDTEEIPSRCYDAGADAFVLMPFRSYREILSLIKRLSALTAFASNRRVAGQLLQEGAFDFAGAAVGADLRIRFKNGQTARLQPKSAGILRLFSQSQGSLVKRSEVMAVVWGSSAPRTGGSLDFYLSTLRALYRKNGHDLAGFISARRNAGWWIEKRNLEKPSSRRTHKRKV